MRIKFDCFRRRFQRDDAGSPAIEFALIAPLIILTMVGVVEFGMIMFVDLSMENALRAASRWGVTGQDPGESTRDEYIVTLINNKLMAVLDPSVTNVELKSYPTFSDIGKAEYDDENSNGKWDEGEAFKDCNGNGEKDADRGAKGAGEAGEAVLYHIDYDWPLLTPMFATIFGEEGVHHIEANIAVRNEPWDVNAANVIPANCDP